MAHDAYRYLSFGEVAKALGVTKSALRNWLTRGQVSVSYARSHQDENFRFSKNDLAAFALVAELVKFGMPVAKAFRAIVAFAETVPEGEQEDWLRTLPYGFLVWRDAGDWVLELQARDEKAMLRQIEKLSALSSFLTVNPGSTLRPVFERAFGDGVRVDGE